MSASDTAAENSIGSYQPSVSADDFVIEAKLFHEFIGLHKLEAADNQGFVYLLSVSWLDQWKNKVNFDLLDEGMDLKAENIRTEIELPPMNEDLVLKAEELDAQGQKFLKTTDETFDLFNVVVRADILEYQNYMVVPPHVWQVVVQFYPNALSVKRILYADPTSGQTRIEVFLPMVD